MSRHELDRIDALERRVAELERRLSSPVQVGTGRMQRLPQQWTPAIETLAWSKEKYPDVDEATEREKFRDYYGSKGESRRDWEGAYRNWIRREADFAKARPQARANGPQTRADAIAKANRGRRDRVAAELAELWREKS